MKNEKTSKRVAKIAARILSIKAEHPRLKNVNVFTKIGSKRSMEWFSWNDIQSVAASCLTQTADKKKTLRPYTVDASTIPELGETFGPRKRKAKRKAKRK